MGFALIHALASASIVSVSGGERVDQALRQRVGRAVALTLQQDVEQRVLDAEQAHRAGDATGAGEQAETDLGQSDLAALHVEGDAVVAGQA